MLIRFKVANYRSFGREVEFSCIATPERAHPGHLFRAPQFDLRLLPVCAIYGANASGKSNLFKAMQFARNLVVSGPKMDAGIPAEPFKLAAALLKEPSWFEFEILVGDRVFNYRFAVNSSMVVSEALKEIRPASECLIFSRESKPEGDPVWNLDYFKSLGWKAEEVQFVEFVAKGTPKNQLFLREAHRRNVKHFDEVWGWFDNLGLLEPDDFLIGIATAEEISDHNWFSNQTLTSLDVGISRLGTKDVPIGSAPFGAEWKEVIEHGINEGKECVLRGPRGRRLTVRRTNGVLKATKPVTYHRAVGADSDVEFDISEESDGTQRILELTPVFFCLSRKDNPIVFFIDELDRSLHSGLTRSLLEGYLSGRPADARAQLIFTTHDTTLFDHKLFRKDELWLIGKNQKGESELGSMGDFKLRSDKRLMRDYLQGRFGGTPDVRPTPFWSFARKEP